MPRFKRLVLTFAAVMNLALLDQLVKAAAVYSLKGKPPLVVIPNIFDLAYVENRGCAWGMLQGHVWPLAVFGALALALVIWQRKKIFPASKSGAFCEILLYAGIIGNMLDRIYNGFVIDLFHLHWYTHHFPVFNVADICITFAAAILIITGLTEKRK